MHEAELALRVLAAKLGVSFHRRPAIRARVDHGDPIEDASIVLGVCVERLDHEPLIGMCSAHLGPTHALTQPPDLTSSKFLGRRVRTPRGTVLDGSAVAARESPPDHLCNIEE
jgi:hypothetical protein